MSIESSEIEESNYWIPFINTWREINKWINIDIDQFYTVSFEISKICAKLKFETKLYQISDLYMFRILWHFLTLTRSLLPNFITQVSDFAILYSTLKCFIFKTEASIQSTINLNVKLLLETFGKIILVKISTVSLC